MIKKISAVLSLWSKENKTKCARWLVSLGLIVMSTAYAWEPTQPIHVIIGQAPVSGNELVFRKMSELVSQQTKAKFLIENHPGLDGVIAWNNLAQRPNNGYHITVQALETSVIALPIMFPTQLKTDPAQAIMVTPLASTPIVFAVKNTSKIRTMNELIQAYRTQPLNVGVSGAVAKLANGRFINRIRAGQQIQTVAYKAIVPNLTDLISGSIDVSVVPAVSAVPLINAGQIRIIAIADDRRMKHDQITPLVSETLAGFSAKVTYALFLPKDTSPDIVDWYLKNFSVAIKDPAIDSWLQDQWSLPFLNPGLISSQKASHEARKLLPIAGKFLTND